MARLTREQQRLLVAEALRNLTKPDLLEDSDLVGLLGIEPAGTGYWPQGAALAVRLTTAAQTVIARLEMTPSFEAQRHLLESVIAGSSINAWAKKQGLSREHVSRTYWTSVTGLVAQELVRHPQLARA